mmetsp:Transcript_50965/g.75617  ORF Transcript_50965/g.75617 Transcript_50965/m.75617 type:complete len:545 (-) Transcript_50965:37-1671(-)|eukprot:CAMPEP_0195520634 /NCGR_PEP_ID=MMETSP0794_2-20130614/17320_1 /TAXON_ID=515487 /ORGANISM="Stephanopyxis turris, Strain CCMP 815" /LENGTH=544 /DNA_ID=CAMNT_0040650033 /DNA_START=125 /DNA_END=1759 /DNA_ORIENTATION=-
MQDSTSQLSRDVSDTMFEPLIDQHDKNAQDLLEIPSESPQRHRSIDDFFEEAYEQTSYSCAWKYWLIILTLGISNLGDASELTNIGFVLASEDFQHSILQDDVAVNGAIVISVTLSGMLIAGLLGGLFEDSIGRRSALILGLSVNSVSCLWSAFLPHMAMFTTLRFFGGVGIGITYSGLLPITVESTPRNRRGFYVTFVALFWSFGSLFVAILAFVVLEELKQSWRTLIAITTLPSVIGLVLTVFLVPESARFLAVHGKYAEAATSANWIAKSMGYQGTMLTAEEVLHYHPPSSQPEPQNMRHLVSSFKVSVQEARKNIAALYSGSLRTRIIYGQLLWIIMEFGSGLSPWVASIFRDLHLDIYFDALLVVLTSLFGYLAAAMIMDKVGRKIMLVCGSLVAAASLVGFLLFMKLAPQSSSAWFVLCACGYGISLSFAWSATVVVTGEIFPTKVRSGAVGLCTASGRTANIAVTFLYGALYTEPIALFSVASVILGIGGLITLLFGVEDYSRRPLADVVDGTNTCNNSECMDNNVSIPRELEPVTG